MDAGAELAQFPRPITQITQPEVTGRFLVAWDPVKQQERWRNVFGANGPGGGTMSTAGGLVFMGNSTFDASSGEKLWEEPLLGDRPVSWISYMLDGKQYLVVAGGPAQAGGGRGGGGGGGRGGGGAAGRSAAPAAGGPPAPARPSRLVAYVLDGKVTLPQ